MSVKIKKVVLNEKGFVVEEYEGTEEEVAAYENKKAKRAQTESAKKQRTVLHGKDLEDIREVVREEVSKIPAPLPIIPQIQLVPIYPQAPAIQPNPWLPTPYWSVLPTITCSGSYITQTDCQTATYASDQVFVGNNSVGLADAGFIGCHSVVQN